TPGVSADGQVMVGSSTSGGIDAVCWSAATGVVVLPNPAPGPFVSAANNSASAANSDGSVVVGGALVQPATGQSFVVPTRWTAASGMRILTLSDGVYLHAGSIRTSNDGGVVLAANTTVYRWQ